MKMYSVYERASFEARQRGDKTGQLLAQSSDKQDALNRSLDLLKTRAKSLGMSGYIEIDIVLVESEETQITTSTILSVDETTIKWVN